MITKNIFPIEWRLSDELKVDYHGCKVFGTFVCGGGSTMGYKLAGFDHIGGVEFTEHYSKVYKKNHNPKYFYLEDIRQFNEREDLPSDLYNLDLLDGSPPCAAFSTSGARERLWNKKSNYENKTQRKDDLVFVYCDTIKKLQPKVAILENVSGLIKGNAKAYTKKIFKELNAAGYRVQLFLLNAASMGIPQIRNRVFFIALRKDIKLPKLELKFNCPLVGFEVTKKYWYDIENNKYSIEKYAVGKEWENVKIGGNSEKYFNLCKPHPKKPCFTITEASSNLSAASVCHPYQKRKLNTKEVILISTFPKDYNFLDIPPASIMGRSVLPVMMANISNQIYLQWLKHIK
jgi:DNA (cytosine-5)-methyltransferase 1